VDAPRHLSLIPLSLLEEQMQSYGLKTLWYTTTDKGTLGWNIFGWEHFFTNFTNLRYIKSGLAIIGKIANILFGPIERRGTRGSAYTAVFQKEK
jgi:hypothetical protein